MAVRRLLDVRAVLRCCILVLYVSILPRWHPLSFPFCTGLHTSPSSSAAAKAASEISSCGQIVQGEAAPTSGNLPFAAIATMDQNAASTTTVPAAARAFGNPQDMLENITETRDQVGEADSAHQPSVHIPATLQQEGRPRRLVASKVSKDFLKKVFSGRKRPLPGARGREALKTIAESVHVGTMPCTFPQNVEPDSWYPLWKRLKELASDDEVLEFQELYPLPVRHKLRIGYRLRSTGPCLMLSVDGYNQNADKGEAWALEVYALPRRNALYSNLALTGDALFLAHQVAKRLGSGETEPFSHDSRITTPRAILEIDEAIIPHMDSGLGPFVLASTFVLRKRTLTSLESLIELRNVRFASTDRALLSTAFVSATLQAIELVAQVHMQKEAIKDLKASDLHVGLDGTLYLDPTKVVQLDDMASLPDAGALRSPPELRFGASMQRAAETDRWQLGFILYRLWCDICTDSRNPYEDYVKSHDSLTRIACVRPPHGQEVPEAVYRIVNSFLQKNPFSRMDPVIATQTREFKELLEQM